MKNAFYIVLDPSSFSNSNKALYKALSAYQELATVSYYNINP